MKMRKAQDTFSVCYRSGGTIDCKWTRVLEVYDTQEEASAKAQELCRAGFKANVYQTRYLNAVGLPVGWDIGAVDWENDEISYSTHETRHRKVLV